VSSKFQHLRHRRGLIGAAAVAAAVAAGLAATGVAGASAATAPVLTTLTCTATGPGGALYRPVGVSAADGAVYASDTGANLVATLASGTTTAFAGSLTAYGEHGDGGPATSASLYRPGGTAVDAKGDLFIADTTNSKIAEVTGLAQPGPASSDTGAGPTAPAHTS
jgi:NHL repeat